MKIFEAVIEYDDIQREMVKLSREFKAECDSIAKECYEEGYPSRGANYEERICQLWDNEYSEAYDYLDERANYLSYIIEGII